MYLYFSESDYVGGVVRKGTSIRLTLKNKTENLLRRENCKFVGSTILEIVKAVDGYN